MYEVFLFVHSWFRWIVLAAGVRILFTSLLGWILSRNWDSTNTKTLFLFNEVLMYQVGMGIALYGFLSPLPKLGWQDWPNFLHDPILRFWTMEHPMGMLLGLAIFQIGRRVTLKMVKIENRFRTLAITLILSLMIILCTIPWPFLKHGRALLRLHF